MLNNPRGRVQDVDKNGVVDYVEWLESVQPNDATLHPFFCTNGGGESLLPKLNERELQQMDNMVDRLERLAERAAAQRVHLMVDAEQTYFQPAIDHMVLNLQKKFNRDFPAIYNTYQCYLTNTAGRVDIDLTRAERHGYHFAAKLVRGAYMVQERKRAAKVRHATARSDIRRNKCSSCAEHSVRVVCDFSSDTRTRSSRRSRTRTTTTTM
jgi:proline dehydrogenase